MRVVVTGGTGFIGRALVHTLMARGDEPVVLTRGRPRSFAHACGECGIGSKAELATWTPDQPGDWQRKIDGADVVVHLAGASVADARWTHERKESIRASRVRTTELLAEAIVKAERPPKVFVSTSATGYYGTGTGDRVVDEAAAPGEDFLASVCVAWEAAAAPAARAGVRVCHPRIGIVLGRGGGILGRMVPLFRAFVGGPIGDGRQFVPWIHLRDVVRTIEAMIDRSDLSGTYNATAPEPVTMDAFTATLGSVLMRPSRLRVPPFALKAAFGEEAAEVILSGQRAVPKRLVDAGFAFVFPDLASALADLVG